MDDLLIVGGGPVGLGAAIFAAQSGLSVRVLEAQPGVIDKACGEGLMPGGVRALQNIGVNIPAYKPFKGIRYVEGKKSAEGHFRSGPGWGIRRTVLHEAIRDRVLELGIPIEHQRVDEVTQNGVFVTANGFRGRYLIAAYGLRSPLRRSYGLQVSQTGPARYGLRRHFQMLPWSEYVEVHWSPYAEAYVTPVDNNLVGVAILFGERFRIELSGGSGKFYHRALQEFPSLSDRCKTPCSSIRGAGPFKTVLSTRVKGRVLFAGDAAGYLDPITGEGLRLGLASAEAAVAAVQRRDPQSYDQQWFRMTRRYWWATSALLALRQQEILRRRIIPTLRCFPRLFNQILSELESG